MNAAARKTRIARVSTSKFERVLAHSVPFGQPGPLANRNSERIRRYLSDLAAEHPGARRAYDTIFAEPPKQIRAILLDSLLRSTVNLARGCVALGNPPEGASLLEPLAEEAIARVRAHDPFMSALHVWDPLVSLGRATQAAFDMHLAKRFPALDVASPTPDERSTIFQAIELLDAILPALAPSMLFHVHLVIVADSFEGKPFRSTTSAYWPGAIVLSRSVLSSVAAAAEGILHEATHAKYIDYEHVFHMYGHGYRPWTAPTVHAPWHANTEDARGWPLSRAATAMHVYTVLTVLFRRARESEHGVWPRRVAVDREQECLSRAKILEGLLRPHSEAFGAEGRSFLEWIRKLLVVLERTAAA